MQKKNIFIFVLICLISVFFTSFKVLNSKANVKTTKINSKKIIAKITPTPSSINTPTPTLTPSPLPTISLTPTLTLIPSARSGSSTPTPTLTPIPSPIIILPSDLEGFFTKYSSEHSVDKELLKRIANCESSLNPNAATTNYAGLFQFAESMWIQTRTLMGLNPDANLRFNAEESVRTAAFLISQNHLGLWPVCSK